MGQKIGEEGRYQNGLLLKVYKSRGGGGGWGGGAHRASSLTGPLPEPISILYLLISVLALIYPLRKDSLYLPPAALIICP